MYNQINIFAIIAFIFAIKKIKIVKNVLTENSSIVGIFALILQFL